MRASEFPDSLRRLFRAKVLSLECSIEQAGQVLDVPSACISGWLNGESRNVTSFNKLKIALFASGFMDRYIDWILEESGAHPLQARALVHSIYRLYDGMQHCQSRPFAHKSLSLLTSDLGKVLEASLAASHLSGEHIIL